MGFLLGSPDTPRIHSECHVDKAGIQIHIHLRSTAERLTEGAPEAAAAGIISSTQSKVVMRSASTFVAVVGAAARTAATGADVVAGVAVVVRGS